MLCLRPTLLGTDEVSGHVIYRWSMHIAVEGPLNMWLALELELCSNVVQCVLSSLGLAFLRCNVVVLHLKGV